MKLKIEENGISYTLVGDNYLPKLRLPEDTENRPIGKYGRLHQTYLKQHHNGVYISLLTQGKLLSYLADINEQAQDMMELLVKQMAEKQGVNERLKVSDQMWWVRLMNNIRNSVEEVVLHDLIYA